MPKPQTNDDSAKTLEEQLAELKAANEKLSKELKAANDASSATQKDLEMAMKLVRLDTTDEEAIDALRYTMGKAGYSHAEIEDYIQAQTNPQPQPTNQPRHPSHPDGAPNSTQGQRPEGGSQEYELIEGMRMVFQEMSNRINSLEGQIKQSTARQTRMTAHDLRERLETQIDGVLDSDKTLATILRKVDAEGQTKAKESLKKEMRLHTKEQLRELSRGQKELTPESVKAAVEKAAAEVGTRYRTVIGDPSMLGRTPETVAEQQRFLNEKPVEAPEFNAEKDTLSDMRAKSREWAADVLQRDVAKASTEESVV